MKKDVFTFIVGGKAGQGIRKAGDVAAKLFIKKKRFVFNMSDYPSLIRGGHNFNIISTSTRRITSHYMKGDLILALDKRSYDTHINKLLVRVRKN
jgi:2-oxoglutarate ferredoxin oxidoreductase subunit alpha